MWLGGDGSPDDGPRAEALFRELLTVPAVAARARYALGVLLMHGGREAEARPLLTATAEAETADGFAAYFLGQLALTDSPADALTWYRRALAREPLLRSAYYGAFLALRRLGQDQEAGTMLERFQTLERHPQAVVAGLILLGGFSQAKTIAHAQAALFPYLVAKQPEIIRRNAAISLSRLHVERKKADLFAAKLLPLLCEPAWSPVVQNILPLLQPGSARASYIGGEKELFLKNLGSGEIAGENFFNASEWTVSLTAQQQTSISVLRRENLARLKQRIPGIESKLIDYYNRYSDFYAALKSKGMDRRVHERFTVEAKILLGQIVDDRDRILSSFRGELADISQGGLSFFIRITKKENVRMLLGRSIKASIPVSGCQDVVLRGTVIGVQVYDLVLSDYSVHVKFNNELARRARPRPS